MVQQPKYMVTFTPDTLKHGQLLKAVLKDDRENVAFTVVNRGGHDGEFIGGLLVPNGQAMIMKGEFTGVFQG